MKAVATRVLLLLLVVCMIIPFASCANGDKTGTEESGKGQTEAQTEAYFPEVEKTNYNRDFTAIYCSDIFRKGYYFVTEEDREVGNDLNDRLYERMMKIKDYLGVDIIPKDGGNYLEYSADVKRCCTTGDNEYQLLMTHVYIDVASMISSGYFLDFQDFDSINLDGAYWNRNLMEDLSVNDAMYCGYNDFCLSNVYLLAFNKDMMKNYLPALDSDLYTMVRNKQWTLSKMIEVASMVSEDNGDGKWDEKDTYGFGGLQWVPLISFMTSSDIKLVDKDDTTGELYVAPLVDNQNKYLSVVEQLVAFNKTNSCYMYFHDVPADKRINLTSNRLLFEMVNNFDLIKYKEESVKIGVLPYPLYDPQQENYMTLNWNGLLTVPNTNVDDMDMVSDVLEMLAFWSDPVKESFYETLLGAKIADAPEDVEMLNIIWNSQVSDLGLVFSSAAKSMDPLLYAIPNFVHNGTTDVSSLFKKNTNTAEKALNKLFE